MPELVFHLRWVDRSRHLCAQGPSETTSQAMGGYLQGALGHPQLVRDCPIRLVGCADQSVPQRFEDRTGAVSIVGGFDVGQNCFQKRVSPSSLEQCFRSVRSGESPRQAFLSLRDIERDDLNTASTFHRVLAIALISHEVLEGGKQKRTKTSAFLPRGPQGPLLDEVGEETLGQVLGRRRIVSAASREGVQRFPVAAAQHGQRPIRAGLA